jgi:hypothetical protein
MPCLVRHDLSSPGELVDGHSFVKGECRGNALRNRDRWYHMKGAGGQVNGLVRRPDDIVVVRKKDDIRVAERIGRARFLRLRASRS